MSEGLYSACWTGRPNRCCSASASIPSGLDDTGLPTGVQLAAAPWRDALVLRTAHAVQGATDWHRRRPPAFA